MVRWLAALLPRPRLPLLTQALLRQVPRLRTVHQVVQLRRLAACWLGAQDLATVDRALHLHLQAMPPPSPKSTLSSAKTARPTGKPRR